MNVHGSFSIGLESLSAIRLQVMTLGQMIQFARHHIAIKLNVELYIRNDMKHRNSLVIKRKHVGMGLKLEIRAVALDMRMEIGSHCSGDDEKAIILCCEW